MNEWNLITTSKSSGLFISSTAVNRKNAFIYFFHIAWSVPLWKHWPLFWRQHFPPNTPTSASAVQKDGPTVIEAQNPESQHRWWFWAASGSSLLQRRTKGRFSYKTTNETMSLIQWICSVLWAFSAEFTKTYAKQTKSFFEKTGKMLMAWFSCDSVSKFSKEAIKHA